MKRNFKAHVLRMMILISAVVLMMLLCGCRTRITNNTEVVGVVNDDNGIMMENYQWRRDELGIPIAEPPLFKGTATEDENYDDYEDSYGDYDEYDKEDRDEDQDEDDEDEDDRDEDQSTQTRPSSTATRPSTSTRPATRPGTSTRPSNRVVKRPSVTQTTTVRVTLNLNGSGAKCSRTSLIVKKGSTYGTLPKPTRSGYDFAGWYTAKEGGTEITSSTKVTSDKAHTIYAHWKEVEAKTFTVTFDGNGGGDNVELSSSEMTVKENGNYDDMPTAKRDKYKFSGWFTEAEGGKQVKSGDKFSGESDLTLYAHWEEDLYNWYNNEFSIAANDITEKVDVKIDGVETTGKKKIVEACKGNVTKDVSDNVVILGFLDDYSEGKAADEADRIYNELNSAAGEGGTEGEGSEEGGTAEPVATVNPTIIIMSSRVLEGSDEEKLVYKIALLDALHGGGSGMDYEAIANELEVDTIEIPPLVVRYP